VTVAGEHLVSASKTGCAVALGVPEPLVVAKGLVVILCLVPPALVAHLDAVELAARRLGAVRVIVDRRGRERRAPERRTGAGGGIAQERRRVRNAGGRRIGERRAALRTRDEPVEGMPAAVAGRVRLVERLAPSQTHVDDLEAGRLVVRFQQRDQAAFVALYERYADDVCGYARSIVGGHEDAEDVTHEVFLRALQGLSTYERRETPFRAWLLTVTRNVALRRRAEQARCEPVADDELFDRMVEPAVFETQAAEGGELAALVAELPAAQRQVVVLRFLADLSPAETATVLDRSPEAVRQLQCRALRTLRGRLAGPDRPVAVVA